MRFCRPSTLERSKANMFIDKTQVFKTLSKLEALENGRSIVLERTAKREISENADVTTYYAVAGNIAGDIRASAQDSKKVRTKAGLSSTMSSKALYRLAPNNTVDLLHHHMLSF